MKNDVKINFTAQDKALLDNLIKIIGRAKIELEGVEILVASDSMRWLSRLQKQIEEEAKKLAIEITNTSPIQESPKKAKK